MKISTITIEAYGNNKPTGEVFLNGDDDFRATVKLTPEASMRIYAIAVEDAQLGLNAAPRKIEVPLALISGAIDVVAERAGKDVVDPDVPF